MIRIIAKLLAVAVALTAFLRVAPVLAEPVAFIANGGSGSACTFAQPCLSMFVATQDLDSGGQVTCLDSAAVGGTGTFVAVSATIDCPGVYSVAFSSTPGLLLTSTNQVMKIRNLTINGAPGGTSAIKVIGSGTLILENCVLENFNASGVGPALDIEPTGPFNLVIKNSRISNGGTVAVVLKPAAGGSINATFDHVTVTNNGGGGIRLDATNGPVTADVTDSVISNNTGNGLNASGGAGAAMLSIHNSVIAKNGAAGVSATGTSGAALIDMTLLDSNASGATSVASGGHILTYGNNRIVGMPGAGFTSTTPLQ